MYTRCDVERLATYVKGTYTDSAEDRAQRHQEVYNILVAATVNYRGSLQGCVDFPQVQLKKGESTSSNVDTD